MSSALAPFFLPGTCNKLYSLTLESNPICSIKHYRRIVCHHIPHLEVLDDQDVTANDRLRVSEEVLEEAMTPRGPSGGGAGACRSRPLNTPPVRSALQHPVLRYRQLSFGPVVEPSPQRTTIRSAAPNSPNRRMGPQLALGDTCVAGADLADADRDLDSSLSGGDCDGAADGPEVRRR